VAEGGGRVSYPLRIVLALLCAAAAVVLALFALDLHGVSQRMTKDDLRFRKSPGEAALWDAKGRLPGDPARKLLGIDDDVRYRSAVRFFRLAGLRNENRSIDQSTFQQAAELQLSRVARSGSSAAAKSAAANLRGVIDLVEASTSDTPGQFLQRSLAEFREAARLDARNQDGRYNLELVLQIASESGGGSDEESGGSRGDTPASGAGAATSGTGY
jgi:L-alanine-DL-glutamate epimerase-like enolase superfamily enzyme